MSQLKMGIIGTGFIANVIADSIKASRGARCTAVSSRTRAAAEAFAAEHEGIEAVEGLGALLSRSDMEAVYIATPTSTKEEIALAAVRAGKHVLVDKPFRDAPSLKRIMDAAAAEGLVFMDATHFVHHPRSAAIRRQIPDRIGRPKSLHTAFYFPASDPTNIRLNPALEPTGALGDMGWYCMRAIVEYLRPAGPLSMLAAFPERDPRSGAVIRVSGILGFESGECSTFDAGYTAGTLIMDLSLLGTRGTISMDDFVLDWHNSFAFRNPEIEAGFLHRTDVAARDEHSFIGVPSDRPQDVLMIERFADLLLSHDKETERALARASLQTQQYLDAIAGILG